jgi:hypothetical protein
LFRLEAMDDAGVLRLVDKRMSGEVLQITLQRVDAAAMLWRLKLLGLDVRQRFAELLQQWPLAEADAGHYAFNDLHAVLALLGAGETARAENWVARCAARVMASRDAERSNQEVAREVGLPLMRGMLAYAAGDGAGAALTLYGARAAAQRFGGSHAQRDLIDQSLMAAAALASEGGRAVGRAVFNERRMTKPATPLTRHWAKRLGVVPA